MKILKQRVKNILPKRILQFYNEEKLELKGHKNEQHYKGDHVVCPCCGKSFNNFMNFIITEENNNERFIKTYQNKVCPYCFSMPRHRIVCYYFDNNLPLHTHTINILLFGAEHSIKKWFNRHGFHYTTADLFDRSADIKIDIQKTPFPDETWDLIICNHVLEHVPDYKIALKELKRILTKNGILELTIPTDRNLKSVYEDKNIITKEERIKYFGQSDHVRIFGNDFKQILIDSGFFVEVINGDELPEKIVGVIGPANYDDNKVYICRKNK